MCLCDLSRSAGIHPTTKAIKPVDLALVQAIDQGGNLGGEHPTKLQALRQNNQGRSEAMASEMCGLPSAIADLLGDEISAAVEASRRRGARAKRHPGIPSVALLELGFGLNLQGREAVWL